MTWTGRLTMLAALLFAAAVGVVFWVLNAGPVDHWLAVHTGTINETGPYYGFWSGFGSDLAEFGVIGAIATGTYQLVKRYNCHEPGCWRVGTHPAAGGQFHLCYRHHPDFQGQKPTHEMIAQLHQEYSERQAAIQSKFAALDARVSAHRVDG